MRPTQQIEEAPAFQQEQVWEIDRRVLVIENELGNNLFSGKYRNTQVCIKFLKNVDVCKLRDLVERRKLSHQNVIKIIGICTEPLNLLVVFEPFFRTVHNMVHRDQTVYDTRTLLRLAYDVAHGMQYLHENKILHGDIQTSDLLMTKDGVVKVFGYDVIGGLKSGTSMHLESVDIFSYGMVLWELITREIPSKFVFELTRKAPAAEERTTTDIVVSPDPIPFKPIPFRKIMEGFLEHFSKKIPKGANPKLVKVMQLCWSPKPPTFSEIMKLLKEDSGLRGHHGLFHYR